jgi:hypothetical protein
MKRFQSNFCIKTPIQVAERVVATHLLLTRSVVEQSDNQMAFNTLLNTVNKPAIKTIQTNYESNLFKKDFKTWNNEELFEVSNRWESLGVLLWSLQVFKELPKEPDYFPKDKMYQAPGIIPAMPDTITTFLDYFSSKELGFNNEHFITTKELQDEINICEAWFWRTKAQIILDFRNGVEQGLIPKENVKGELRKTMENIQDAIKYGSEKALEKGFIKELVKDDFGVGGVPFAELDDHLMRDLTKR